MDSTHGLPFNYDFAQAAPGAQPSPKLQSHTCFCKPGSLDQSCSQQRKRSFHGDEVALGRSLSHRPSRKGLWPAHVRLETRVAKGPCWPRLSWFGHQKSLILGTLSILGKRETGHHTGNRPRRNPEKQDVGKQLLGGACLCPFCDSKINQSAATGCWAVDVVLGAVSWPGLRITGTSPCSTTRQLLMTALKVLQRGWAGSRSKVTQDTQCESTGSPYIPLGPLSPEVISVL